MSRKLLFPALLATAGLAFYSACDDSSGGASNEQALQPSSGSASAPAMAAHRGHVDMSPGNFQPGPPFFPPGSQIAVLQGDPSSTGEFTVRLKFPAGYLLPPHFHPTDENVTVLGGTFLVGIGDAVKLDSAIKLTSGGFITAPATAHHYAFSRTETLVQVHGLGPFEITYVNPSDDPRN